MKNKVEKTILYLSLLNLLSIYPVFSQTESLGDLADKLGNIVTTVIGIAGLVLVAMIAYGVWKSSMSLGDARGLEGAKQTWTYALYGFLIIAGVYTILAIISGLFGVSFPGLGGIVGGLKSALSEFTSLPQ